MKCINRCGTVVSKLLQIYLLLGWMTLTEAVAAAPEIGNLSLRGLQTGAATTLTIDGSDLLPEPRVILPIAIAKQSVKTGATANRVQIEIDLPAEVSPGLYHLRVANARGISRAVVIGIDRLAQMPFASAIAQLPAALHGNLGYGATLQTSFAGKKGQRMVVDLEARRLGAAFDPIIELYDPQRVQVAYAQGSPTLNGDARIDAILPADGQYTVDLHDVLYQGGEPNFFRLKIGSLSYADLVFPLGGQRGTENSFELIGNPAVKNSALKIALRRAGIDVPAPLPAEMIGPAPRVFVGDFAETLKSPQAGKLQEVMAPAVINGRIEKPHSEDRYRLLVKPGMNLRFDVMANRAGSPLDGVLSIRNEAGVELAMSDDRPDTVDPGLDFAVPAGVNALVVALKDLEGRGGRNFLYRLSVTPADRPDFALTLLEDRLALPQGGAGLVRVRVNRVGFDGPIKLSVPGLPQGVMLSGDEIPSGATDALLTFSSKSGLAPVQVLTTVIGESTFQKERVHRRAMLPETSVTRFQPWLRSELAVAITEPNPIRIAWESKETSLALGSTFPAAVRVDRAAGADSVIRLSLVTSQVVPRTADGKQEDRNRALRLQGMPSIASGRAVTEANILVPADLPAIPYDIALKAELLNAQGNMVLATAVSPARRLIAAQPFTLQLAGAAAIKAKSGAGPSGKLTGKVLRAGGFNRPVTITLAGLPPELPAPAVLIAGDRSDFELPVSFPYESKLGPLPNIKLVATSSASSQNTLKSNEILVAIEIVKGDPPPASPPLYRVFDDEAYFAALLHEGDGQVALESVDRYSGSVALRVAGTQRFRSKMPGWNFKIAEKPGLGEFRFLRFAWKKRGGSNIVLQLNANNAWGPQRGKPGPSYRYEAGPGDNAFQAAALKIDPRLPDDWVVVTRDLFADFGAFTLTGIAFTPGPGEYGLFDHIYLARSLDDLKGCLPPITPNQPRAIFEDQAQFVANLLEGAGTASLEPTDKYSGKSSVKVTPDQRFNERLPGLGLRIRQNPGFGEYRFLRFAWKKKGGETVCLQLNHDGSWGPSAAAPGKFRYHAGPGPEPYGASIAVDDKIPADWVVVTRDLYADFGEFTWTGIALSPVDGEFALFDHIYLGRTTRDFELVKPEAGRKK